MKRFLFALFATLFISCNVTNGYFSDYREGYVIAKYTVTVGNNYNNTCYVIELEDKNNKRFVVQTNYKAWKLSNLGCYTVLKRYQ